MRNFNEDYSLVRFLHAVPNGDSVDLQVNEMPFFNDLNFTNFTPYMYMPNGTYTIAVFSEDTIENPLVKQTINIGEEELLTIAIITDNGFIRLLPIKEDIEIADRNKTKTRFVHLVSNGREVDITLNGKRVFEEVGYTEVTPYTLIAPGSYDVDVEASINGDIINSSQIKIGANRIYTFYALGEAPNFEVFQSLDGAVFLI